MSGLFEEINVKFPKDDLRIKKSFENCETRKRFVKVPKDSCTNHLDMAKDDLVALKTDLDNKNWRWVITKSYYAIFHATNALLINKLGFYSKDHLCAVIALKKENLISEELYSELGLIYERFSDIFGFAIMFEARKLSQYDVEKWRDLTKKDAIIARDFANKYVGFVESECQ